MSDVDLFFEHQWKPLAWFGFNHPFWALEAETVVYTWVALGFMALLALAGRIWLVRYPNSLVGFSIKWCTRSLMSMITQACKRYEYRYISFFFTLFVFLLVCNCLIVVPFMEEPTKDLNTTLALSILTFLFIQYEAVRVHGLLPHLNDYFKTPFAVRGVYRTVTPYAIFMLFLRVVGNIAVGLMALPLELMGKLSNIISLAFRLFGNILAGSVISSLWLKFRSGSVVWHVVGVVTGINLLITLFFGIFEGCVQAFVFVMLSLTFLSRALQHN